MILRARAGTVKLLGDRDEMPVDAGRKAAAKAP